MLVVPDASVILKLVLEREGGMYVTADQRYFGRAGGKGRVVLLSQWKSSI
jgi:hypothetical protein